ncbi:MAG: T9SS type A sorting domain-containing protein, partial [Chitinophagales bacterium]
TISNLCPNTYYEISCWLRNICSKCGCDSNGKGASNAGYIPTAPGDSSGVSPNLTFNVNNISYYTTGNIGYSGTWIKKGFTVLTGPVQTSFTVKFFNNAPGGGGNDWALDDISVATCTPNLTLLPSANPMICSGNIVDMSSVVKSFFNNYTYYKWQRSTNNGVSWTDDGPSGGPATPTWSGSDWEYTVAHPTFVGNMSDSGSKYRMVIATTSANLSDANCAFSQSTVITLSVLNCGPPLDIDILSFTGKEIGNMSQLSWTTSTEDEPVQYVVEKSSDARSFKPVGAVNSYNNGNNINSYSFNDPDTVRNAVYYRLRITDANTRNKYSRIIQLNGTNDEISFTNVINPFDQKLQFEILAASNGRAQVNLISLQGGIVKQAEFSLNTGINSLAIGNTEVLPVGVYILRVQFNGKILQRKLVKINSE